jgi:hypothetical protein
MKNSNFVARGLAIALLATFTTSQAVAGTCTTDIRNFPAGTENINMTCKTASGSITRAVVTAQTVAGTKSLIANLTAAPAGQSATSEGLNAAGSVIAGCTATDSTPGGATGSVNCAAAVKWRGTITFAG